MATKVTKGKPTEEKVVIPYKKGQKIADVRILAVHGQHVEYDDEAKKYPKRQIEFIQLKKETRDSFDPRANIVKQVPTGKIITTGGERSMSVEDFKDFVARKLTAGQVLA